MSGQNSGEKPVTLLTRKPCMFVHPLSGKLRIAHAHDVFSYIDPDYNELSHSAEAVETHMTRIRAYEMNPETSFTKGFASIDPELHTLCFTQHQIREIVRAHKKWLGRNYRLTALLFKDREHFYVAIVLVDSKDSANISVDPLGKKTLWDSPTQLIVPL